MYIHIIRCSLLIDPKHGSTYYLPLGEAKEAHTFLIKNTIVFKLDDEIVTFKDICH